MRALGWRVIAARVQLVEAGDYDPMLLARQLAEAVATTSRAEVCRQVGRSGPWVSNIVAFLRLDPSVAALVSARRLSPAHAKAICRLEPDDQVRLARRAVAERLSAHQLEAAAKRTRERAA